MKKTLMIITLFVSIFAFGQDKYFTRSGHIDFYSHAPLEDIRANNDQVAAILETKTGILSFAILMKSFEFKKALMQEHFNENYIESDEFPRSKFKGTIKDYNKINVSEEGEYKVIVKGMLSLHGVEKEIEVPGVLNVAKGMIVATSKFTLKPEDFDIKIPQAVRNNIAKIIDVNVHVELLPYKK